MPDLSAGRVTFLFTDIEGSTRILHALGDGYAEVLSEHRRLLRAAFVQHGGVEVDTRATGRTERPGARFRPARG